MIKLLLRGDWQPVVRGTAHLTVLRGIGYTPVMAARETFHAAGILRQMQTRCECRELSFASLLAYARRHGITGIEELIKATGCCTGCGRCRPLLEELLRSGKLRVGDLLIDLPNYRDDLPDPPLPPK